MPITYMNKTGVEFIAANYNEFRKNIRGANSDLETLTGSVYAVSRAQGREIAGLSQWADTLIAGGNAALAAGGSIGGLGKVLLSLGGVASSVLTGPAAPFVAIGAVVLPMLFDGAKKAGNAIQNILVTSLKVLGQVASTVGGVLLNIAIKPFELLGEAIRRIFYISGGVLVADLFRGLIREIRDMGTQAVQAASDFQLLNIRMEGLLARDIINGMDEMGRSATNFDDALRLIAPDVQEIFDWITKLAVRTPFTIEDITNTFTLAKAYGLTTTKTKQLIAATGNFAAGMGLTGEHIQRIIENLGQMIQQGKITGTEMRDLARGSFMPVTEILEEMGKKYGYTAEQMRDMAKDGTADVMEFIDAFITVSERDFPNAMSRMSRTFETVKNNIKDFVQAIIGFKILAPAANFLSDKLAMMLESVLSDPRLTELADQIGQMLLGGLSGNFPDMDPTKIAGNFITFLQGITALLSPGGMLAEAGSGGMGMTSWMTFFENAGVPQWVIDSVANLRAAWETIKMWWAENKDIIIGYVTEVMDTLGLKNFDVGETFENATGAIYDFSVWMLQNGEQVNEYLAGMAQSVQHIADATLPLLTGDKTLEDIFNPTMLDGIASGFYGVWLHATWLWKSVLQLKDTFLRLLDTLGIHVDKVYGIKRAVELLKIPIDLLTIAIQLLNDAFSILIGWIETAKRLGVWSATLGIGQGTVPLPPYMMDNAIQGNSGTTNNNTVNVQANYSNTQSPSTVAHDVRSSLAAITS